MTEKLKRLTVDKTAYSEYGNYHYRSIDDILNAVEDSGQFVTLTDDLVDVCGRPYIKATAIAGTGEQATGYAAIDFTHGKMSDDQCTGAASTYARKYALCGLFGIGAGDDPDTKDTGKNKELIDAEQVKILQTEIEALNINYDEFCKYNQVLKIEDVTKGKFTDCMGQLQKRRRTIEKAAAEQRAEKPIELQPIEELFAK